MAEKLEIELEPHRKRLNPPESNSCDKGHELVFGPVASCSQCGGTFVAIFVEPADCLYCDTRNTVRRTPCSPNEKRVYADFDLDSGLGTVAGGHMRRGRSAANYQQ